MKAIKATFVAFLFTTSACTVDGELSSDDRNKLMKCTDTRDGEIFYYNTNTVRNVRIGVGVPSSVEITTTDGIDMRVNTEMNQWIKCIEVKQNEEAA